MTNMRLAFFTVDSRWAMMMVVRFFISCSSAACTRRSLSESSELVASSNNRMGGSFSKARAMGNALPLAAGKARAFFTEKTVVPLRERADEFIGRGRHRGLLDIGVGCIRPAKADIFPGTLPNNTVSWGTNATCRRKATGSSCVTSLSSIRIRPDTGS